jgi:hypothetical protein
MGRDEILAFFRDCVRRAERMEEYFSEELNYDPEDLADVIKERECYLAAIRALEKEETENDQGGCIKL